MQMYQDKLNQHRQDSSCSRYLVSFEGDDGDSRGVDCVLAKILENSPPKISLTSAAPPGTSLKTFFIFWVIFFCALFCQ